MRRILCFGDSNTWGYNPLDASRYDENTRWPMVLESTLGAGYRVIEEGMNGRTFSMDDPNEGGYRSGIQYLPPCLVSHDPLDLVIVMLGTNDTKEKFSLNTFAIALNLRKYASVIREYAINEAGEASKILIVAPPKIGAWVEGTLMGPHFGADAPNKAALFATEFRRYAKLYKTEYFDAGAVVEPSKRDGVHLTAESHRILGRALAQKILEIL